MHTFNFGILKKRPSKKELIGKYTSQSSCVVRAWDGGLGGFEITFYGALANVPSLKNKKIPGTNFTNPDVIARIASMDILFKEACPKPPFFGKSEVFVVMVCASRARSFDLIGCMETIQDWLEPSSKMVGKKSHKRGWGIGLIDNDSQVTPFPLKSELFGEGKAYTKIYVAPIKGCPKRMDLTRLFARMGYMQEEREHD